MFTQLEGQLRNIWQLERVGAHDLFIRNQLEHGTIEGHLTDSNFVRLVVLDGPAKDRYILYADVEPS